MMNFLYRTLMVICLVIATVSCTTVVVNDKKLERDTSVAVEPVRHTSQDCVDAVQKKLIAPTIPATPVKEFSKLGVNDTAGRMTILVKHIEDLNKYIVRYDKKVVRHLEQIELHCVE